MVTNWVDRVPTYPGKWKITRSDGSYEYVTMERADEPTVEGTPVNAANLNAIEAGIVVAQSTATDASSRAYNCMPYGGGTFTGNVKGATVGGHNIGVRNMIFYADDETTGITENISYIKCYDK